MSKKMYLWLYAGSLGGAILFQLVSIPFLMMANNSGNEVSPIVAFLGIISIFLFLAWLIIHIVFYFLMLAKMWGAIQDGYAEMSVGEAIGYLFIPFFNIYWIFKAWGGYPNEYNAYIARNGIDVPPLSNGVFIAFPIILILGAFYIPLLALPFVMIAVIIKVCDAVNAIENAPINSNNKFHRPPAPSLFNLNE